MKYSVCSGEMYSVNVNHNYYIMIADFVLSLFPQVMSTNVQLTPPPDKLSWERARTPLFQKSWGHRPRWCGQPFLGYLWERS